MSFHIDFIADNKADAQLALNQYGADYNTPAAITAIVEEAINACTPDGGKMIKVLASGHFPTGDGDQNAEITIKVQPLTIWSPPPPLGES